MGIYKQYVEGRGGEGYKDITFQFTKRFYLRDEQVESVRVALEKVLQVHYHDYELKVRVAEFKEGKRV